MPHAHDRARHLLALALLLLVLMAIRTTALSTLLDYTVDEVWSVWQSVGSPSEIIQRTPFDWPPGYYLALGAWQALAGSHPVILRYAMVLAFLVGAASAYKAGETLYQDRAAGVFTVLFYAVSGWALFISLHLRGHSLVFSLAPLVMWLALRYIQRPRWQKAVPLALAAASMMYVHSTVVVFYVALGLFTLILTGLWRGIRLWVFPALLIALVVSPEVLHKLTLAVDSRQSLQITPLQPLPHLAAYITQMGAQASVIWVGLLVVGGVLFVVAQRPRPRLLVAGLFWLIFPLVLFTPALQDIFRLRYTSWFITGLALVMAGGYRMLARSLRLALMLALLVFGAWPTDLRDYDAFELDVGTTFAVLAPAMHQGDVVFIDPDLANNGNIIPEEWDTFREAFFPHGLPVLPAPTADNPRPWTSARRVWYLRSANFYTPTIREQMRQTHIPGKFIGPPDFFFELYEAPPNPDGIPFDNGMRYLGADILHTDGAYLTHYRPVFREQTHLRVRTWWTVDERPPVDYSLSVFVMDDTGAVTHADHMETLSVLSPVADVPSPRTSEWQPGRLYLVEHDLLIRGDSARIAMTVYQWWDGVRIGAPGADADNLLDLFDFTVKAW